MKSEVVHLTKLQEIWITATKWHIKWSLPPEAKLKTSKKLDKMLQNNLFNSQLLVPSDSSMDWVCGPLPPSLLSRCLLTHLGLKRNKFSLPSITRKLPKVHMVSVSGLYLLRLWWNKCVTERFHPAIISFLKAQLGNFHKGYHPLLQICVYVILAK